MTAAPPGARARLRPIGRSIFGLLAGFCLILVLSVLGYATLLLVLPRHFNAAGDPLTPTSFVAIVAYTTVFSFGGAVVATRLARRAAMVHAAILAAMQAAALVSSSRAAGPAAPSWYAGTLIGLAVAAILVAGWREAGWRVRAAG